MSAKRGTRRRRRTSERRERLGALTALVVYGLPVALAAAAIAVHRTTAERWRRREDRHERLARRRGPAPRAAPLSARAEAEGLVRETHGLVGASALSHSVLGLSRREAAAVKRATCTVLERERRAKSHRVVVTVPGILRGFDGFALHRRGGHLLVAADGCVPYRTSWLHASRYDEHAVARLLEEDFTRHGAPLVLRFDRARAHDTAAVREVLSAHAVLSVHGPAHYPCYYAQTERQMGEHRRWTEADLEDTPDFEAMMQALNERWPRSTLGWCTAGERWRARPALAVDRGALLEDVRSRAARLERRLSPAGRNHDLCWRLAVKQALVHRGFLRIEKGGWC